MKKLQEKFVHVGNYVARLEVEFIYPEDSWSPCLTIEDAEKLDAVRDALKKEDLAAAGKLANIFKLTPVTKAA
ncbi:MAG: hypothetical protein ACQETH_16345 [Candidatus Rifleibacteriota bacterium]